MSRFLALLICVTLITTVMIAGQARAADEDTQASVYLVFDPETGDFVTVDDPGVTKQHAAAQLSEDIRTGVSSSTDAAAASGAADASGAASSQPPMVLVIGAAIAVLVLGGFFWMRRGRQSAA